MPSRRKPLIVATICSIVMVSGAAAAANAALLSQVGESKQLPTGKLALPASSRQMTVVDPSDEPTDSSVQPVTTPAAITTTTTTVVVAASVDPAASTVAEPTDVPDGTPAGPGKSSPAPATTRNSSSATTSPPEVKGSQVTAPASTAPVATPVRGTSPATSTAPPASPVSTPSPTSAPEPEPVAPSSPSTSARQRPVSTPPTTRARTTSTTHPEDDGKKEHPDD
jgi:hypothetical protein